MRLADFSRVRGNSRHHVTSIFLHRPIGSTIIGNARSMMAMVLWLSCLLRAHWAQWHPVAINGNSTLRHVKVDDRCMSLCSCPCSGDPRISEASEISLKHLHHASRASLVVAPGLLQNADGQIDKVIWTSTLPAPRNLMGSTAQLSVLQTAGVVEGVVSGYKP